MSGEYAAKLAEMADTYSAGVAAADGVPDAEYIMQLQGAIMKESSNGNLMVSRQHLIREGELAGIVVFDNLVLSTPFGMANLVSWLKRLGYDAPEDPVDLEPMIEQVANEAPMVKASTKSKDGFTNVRVLEVLEGGGESEAPPTGPPAAAGKTPVAKKKTAASKTASGPGKAELMAFAQSFSLKGLDDNMDKDALVELINQFDYPAKDLEPADKELLKAIA